MAMDKYRDVKINYLFGRKDKDMALYTEDLPDGLWLPLYKPTKSLLYDIKDTIDAAIADRDKHKNSKLQLYCYVVNDKNFRGVCVMPNEVDKIVFYDKLEEKVNEK